MKRNTIFIASMLLATVGFGQEAEHSESDTTKIKLGSSVILIVENAPDQDVDHNFGECDSTSQSDEDGTAAFLDIGMAGFMTPDFDYNLPQEYGMMELDYARSRALAFHVMGDELAMANDRLYLKMGFGLSWNSLAFDNNISIAATNDTIMFLADSITANDKYRLRSTYLEVPALVGVRLGNHDMPVGLQVGVIGGYKIGARIKQKYTIDDATYKAKIKDDLNFNPFKVDAVARVSIGDVGLFAKYSMLQLFQNGDGPELYPFSIGITFGDFKVQH